MFENIPLYVSEVLSVLERAGHSAYIVGGCVRDALLGREPQDYDITTSATPDELLEIFSSYNVVTSGLKHGTVGVISQHICVEVTTFRVDGEYKDSRHPDKVTFTRSLEDDLARRDFTINAMAYSRSTDLVDIYGGKEDLEKGIVRCVGDSEKRFTEDALRILRCLRFASTLGFEIEENTAAAAKKLRGNLKNISAERKATEFIKLLCGDSAERVIRDDLEVICEIVPELALQKDFDQKTKYHNLPLLDHTLSVLSHTPPVPALRLAALFHDTGKPYMQTFGENGQAHYLGHAQKSLEIANRVMHELKLDNKTRHLTLTLIEWHDTVLSQKRAKLKRVLAKLGKETFDLLMLLKRADNASQSIEYDRKDEYDNVEKTVNDIVEKGECYTLGMLDINGSDLIANNVAKGADIGRILDALLELVITEQVKNEKEALLNAAKKIK